MPSFSNEMRSFISKHKYLCIGTVGLAIGVYAIGNLCGRAVKHLRKCHNSTVEKTDMYNPMKGFEAEETVSTLLHPSSASVVSPRIARPKLKVPVAARYDLLAQDWLTNVEIAPLLRDLALEFPELYVNKFQQIIPDYLEIKDFIIEDLEALKASTENDQKKFIAYPLNINMSHWTLIFIDREKQTIEYYDSMVNYGPYKKIQNALKKVTAHLNQNGESYSLVSKITKTVQGNGIDCGPWILYFAEERITKGPDFTTTLQKQNFIKTSALMKNYRIELSNRAFVYKLKMDVLACEKNLKMIEAEGDLQEAEYDSLVDEYNQRLKAAKEAYNQAIV